MPSMAQEIEYAASFGRIGIVPHPAFFLFSGDLFLQKSNFFSKNAPIVDDYWLSSTIAR